LLQRDGVTLRLGSRALSLLVALVSRRGELVGKDVLLAEVWPKTFVEEANLRVHIAVLRKALGDTNDPPQYIANVAGRGYRFVATISDAPASASTPSRATRPAGAASLTRLIGRDEEVATLVDRVVRRRLITVSGPGGIGKTSVAFAVIDKVQEAFEDGIVTVDLGAAAADENGLPQAVAIALKVSVPSDDPVPALVSYLRDKNMLLVLDNCEHIIDAVTETAEQLLRQSSRLHILATSTEPMRAEGEWIYRLLPLAVPSEAENLKAQDALTIPAIELFVERAAASSEAFQFTDEDVALVSEICRRLDGNPLAMEIAAASVEAFGLRDLAAHLDDRFDVLVRGRRTAAPRQQTLRNLLDWSHSTLSESEQTTLRRLSIFRGAFTLDAARAVSGAGGNALAVINDVASLVRKSLLVVNVVAAQATYRLLDSTHAYARDKARQAGELDGLSQLHATYFEGLLQRAEDDWPNASRGEWLERYGYIIDDARAATDWALGPGGKPPQGVRLTSLLLPLCFQFGLIEEVNERTDAALARAADIEPRELLAEIKLRVSRSTLGQTRGTQLPPEDADLTEALRLAALSGVTANRVSPLTKIAIHHLNLGDYDEGLRCADEALASLEDSDDDLVRLGVNRVLAQASDMAGVPARARRLAHQVVLHPARNIPLLFGSLQIERQISMRVVLARSMWMQGLADQAKLVALEALRLAREDGPNAIGLAISLGAGPVALWSGFDDEAENLSSELREKSDRYTLGMYALWAQIFEHVLARRRGDPPQPIAPTVTLHFDSIATFDAKLLNEDSVKRARAGRAGWANPEILRAYALRQAGSRRSSRHDEVWATLEQSMALAHAHGALAWELRTATTMAEMLIADGREADAIARLEPVYSRLVEGHRTTDALKARDILEGRVSR
jgi:predicted ATPase/DNA-binding winged helix-turn-helix (wHTH) protein